MSFCATHRTYPEPGEPCWSCANPHILAAENHKLVEIKQAGHAAEETAGMEEMFRLGETIKVEKKLWTALMLAIGVHKEVDGG